MAMNGGGNVGVGVTISAVDRASATFRSVRSSFKNFREGFKKYTAIEDPMMSGIFSGAIGMGLKRFGGAMTRTFRGAFAESAAFQKAIAEVGTLVNDLDFPRAKMEQMAESMAATYGIDAKEQAKALYQTISAGFTDVNRAAELMDAANKLAIGGVTSTAVAVDGLTTVVNAFAKDNVTAAQTSDAFFVAIKAGKTTAEELSASIGRLAPTTAAANISMEETLAALAAITTQGIQTSEAVSGMRAAMANLIKPSALAKEEAKRLGIQFDSSAVRSKGLKGVLDSITTSAGFNEQSFEKLFGGVEGLNAIMALSANGGAKFTEVLGQMGASAGATDEAFNKMTETADFQLKRLAAIRTNISRSLGKSVGEMFAPVLKALVGIVSRVEEFVRAIPPDARKTLLGIAAAIGTIVSVAGGLMVVSGVMKAFGLSFIGVAFSAFKVVAALAILTPLVAGLGIGFFALYKAATKGSEGFGLTLKNLREKVSLAFKGMIQIVSEGKLSKAMEAELAKAENRGVLRFIRGFERFKERFGAFWSGIKRGFEQGVDALSRSAAFARFRRSFEGLIRLFTGSDAQNSQAELEQWGAKGEAAGLKLAGLGEVAADIGVKLLDFTKQAAEAFAGFTAADFAKGVDTAVGAFYKLWDALSVVGTALSAIYNTLKLILSVVFEVIDNLSDLISYQWIADKRAPKIFTKKGWEWTADAAGDLADTFSAQAEHVARAEQRGAPTRYQMMHGGRTREQDLASLLDQQRKIATWVETPATEWAKIRGREGGGPLSFAEAPVAMQREFLAKFDNLARQIERLGGRPIEVKAILDGKEVGKGVEDAGASEDARNLGGGGRTRTFAPAPAAAAGR